MYSNVFFEPCVGKDYGSSRSIFRKKLLVLGDSHYCNKKCETCGDRDIHPECRQFTQKIVDEYLDPQEHGTWKKTFSTFLNSIFGVKTSLSERTLIFDSVAFYNFLQVSAGANAASANEYDYYDPKYLSAYYEVLNQVKPDVVILWGNRVWDVLPSNWGFGEAKNGVPFSIDSASFSQYMSCQFCEKEIVLVGIHHPCSGFPSDFYHEVFSRLGIIPCLTS